MEIKNMNQDQFIQHLEDERVNDAVRVEFIRLIHDKASTNTYRDEYKKGLFDAIELLIKAEKNIKSK